VVFRNPIDSGTFLSDSATQNTVPGESIGAYRITRIVILVDSYVVEMLTILGNEGVMLTVGCEVGVDDG
jgi:hypothetical protein